MLIARIIAACVALLIASFAHAQTPTPTAACSGRLKLGSDTFHVCSMVLPTPTFGGLARPVDIALNSTRAFASAQFADAVYSVNLPADGNSVVDQWPIPLPSPRIFRTSADAETGVSVLQDSLRIGWDDSVFFVQGGGFLYTGTNTKASRVMRLHPSPTPTWQAYSIATNNFAATGLHVDTTTHEVFVGSQGPAAVSDRVIRFDADDFSGAETDPLYNYTGVLPKPAHFFRVVPGAPASTMASQMRQLADGRVAVAGYWNNALGVIERNPFPDYSIRGLLSLPSIGSIAGDVVTSGTTINARRPWGVAQTSDGDIWFALETAHQLARVSDDCGQVTIYNVGGLDATEYLHSLSVDSDDNVWFSVYVSGQLNPWTGRVGRYHSASGTIQTAVLSQAGILGGVAGIQVDLSRDDDVWLTLFNQRKIAFLRGPF